MLVNNEHHWHTYIVLFLIIIILFLHIGVLFILLAEIIRNDNLLTIISRNDNDIFIRVIFIIILLLNFSFPFKFRRKSVTPGKLRLVTLTKLVSLP